MIALKTLKWEISNINGILFDKDGTLIDSHLYWGRIINLRSQEIINKFKLNKALHPSICRFMGYSLAKRRLLPKGPVGITTREEVISILHHKLTGLKINISEAVLSEIFIGIHAKFLTEIKNYVKILPGVLPFLKQLKEKKITTAIVTVDVVKNTEETINLLKINKYFDLIIGKEHTAKSKISGAPAQKALTMLKLNKEQTVCVGDAPMDLIMAQKAGLKAGIGIALGQTPIKTLVKYSSYCVRSYQDLFIV